MNDKKMVLIAGPCAIESLDLCLRVAEHMLSVSERLGYRYIFKASFDKANRSSIDSSRGLGLKKGLEVLSRVKEDFDVSLTTDIHEPWQAAAVAEVVDMIQIPAFLCRQTDLLVAAAKTGKIVNVKKAQFLAPWDMKNVITKLEKSNAKDIWLTERGTTFGYNTLVVDYTGLVELKKFGYPVVFDATHSVQKPGGLGLTTGGNREYIEHLANAAAGVGIDKFFFEVHPEPEKAISDGPNQVPLYDIERILKRISALNQVFNT